jgi:hypothetical protein
VRPTSPAPASRERSIQKEVAMNAVKRELHTLCDLLVLLGLLGFIVLPYSYGKTPRLT